MKSELKRFASSLWHLLKPEYERARTRALKAVHANTGQTPLVEFAFLRFGRKASVAPNSQFLYCVRITQAHIMPFRRESLKESIVLITTATNRTSGGFPKASCQGTQDNRKVISGNGTVLLSFSMLVPSAL